MPASSVGSRTAWCASRPARPPTRNPPPAPDALVPHMHTRPRPSPPVLHLLACPLARGTQAFMVRPEQALTGRFFVEIFKFVAGVCRLAISVYHQLGDVAWTLNAVFRGADFEKQGAGRGTWSAVWTRAWEGWPRGREPVRREGRAAPASGQRGPALVRQGCNVAVWGVGDQRGWRGQVMEQHGAEPGVCVLL